MGYVLPRRRGRAVANEWMKGSTDWKEDRRQLLVEQDRQHDEDLEEMDRDNEGKNPLWPEDQYVHLKKCPRPRGHQKSVPKKRIPKPPVPQGALRATLRM